MTTTTMTKRTTPRRIPSVVAATIAAGSLAVGGFWAGSAASPAVQDRPLRIERIEFTAVTDFSDDRRLVGFAEDVFFGEVLDDGRTSGDERHPETDYRVKVVETIKGDANGVVTVTQEGGYIAKRNEVRLMEGDALLEPGHVYLFATRSDPKGRHFVVPEHGDVKVRSKEHHDQLRERARQGKNQQIAFDHRS